MIDSHCHLADAQFDADRDAVIRRAIDAGVRKMVTIADSLPEGKKCAALANAYDEIFCTVGVHPHHAKEWGSGNIQQMKTVFGASKKCVAVGEIGLDYHYDFSPRESQRETFHAQLLLAKELGLPAVVHCREAIVDVRAIVEEVDAGPFVLHCCTERWEDVAWIIERGSLLSFTGIATFPKSDVIRETIRRCPIESMMVETDAPYLAPIPYRGQRCEPAYVMDVARFIAAEKGMELEEFDRITTKTTMAFFGLPS